MGGAVSELRGAIHMHVLIAQRYPTLLEPTLAVVQFFLRTAEAGEGADRERALGDVRTDMVLADKRLFEEASTEVELLVENADVTRVLLRAVATYHSLELAPETDPLRRWYDPPWRAGKKPMPRYVEVPSDQVPRFRIALLRSSVRCLRLLMLTTDGKALLEELRGPDALNQAALENPLDDYVKNDVKAIFRAVYGGENAVRRIAIGDVAAVMEMLRENADSAIVQLASVQRVCQLLAEAKAFFYTPLAADAPPDEAVAAKRQKLFAEIEAHGVVALLTESLTKWDVDKCLALYVHVCRFISYVAVEERNAKLVAQSGGVVGAVQLLLKAREMQRHKRLEEKEEVARQARLQALAAEHRDDDWAAIVDGDEKKKKEKKRTQPPPAPPHSGAMAMVSHTSLESLAVVDFTPTEIGQQAIWALDLLAQLDFNVAQMKRAKLKYVLEEIRLDPDSHELGQALIITRRLRLIRWDEIVGSAADESRSKSKSK